MIWPTKHAAGRHSTGSSLKALKHPYLALLVILGMSAAGVGGRVERGVLIREANVYTSPDVHAQRLAAPLERGSEVAILEKGSPGWVHIEPISNSISGWTLLQ